MLLLGKNALDNIFHLCFQLTIKVLIKCFWSYGSGNVSGHIAVEMFMVKWQFHMAAEMSLGM